MDRDRSWQGKWSDKVSDCGKGWYEIGKGEKQVSEEKNVRLSQLSPDGADELSGGVERPTEAQCRA